MKDKLINQLFDFQIVKDWFLVFEIIEKNLKLKLKIFKKKKKKELIRLISEWLIVDSIKYANF